MRTRQKPLPSSSLPAPGPRVCVVGSGWHFYSGISLFTCRRVNAFAERHDTSAILMRKLVPRVLYPGARRVGQPLSRARYRADAAVLDGVDYFWFPSLLRAAVFLWRRRPDVLVVQWWTGAVLHSYLALALVARLCGCRIVLEFHEIQDTGEARNRVARAYVDGLINPLLSMTSGAVVHSRFDVDALRARFDLGSIPIRVIPHGPFDHLGEVHEDSPAPDRAAAVTGRGGDAPEPRPYTFLFFGTIRPYKGLEYLVRAFNSLTAQQASELRLVIVGETWEGWTRPAELIAAGPHRDRITFVNRYVHDDEAARHFAEADAVVLPYLRSSASGPLHIAMSLGLPVAVSRVGGLVEAADDYAGASFVRPGSVDDLAAVLADFPRRTRERFSDPHSWARGAEQFDDLFREVLGDGTDRFRGRRRLLDPVVSQLDARSIAPARPQPSCEPVAIRPNSSRLRDRLGNEDAARI